jgi:hypothetical protein
MLKCTSNEPKWSVIATRRKRTTVKDQMESCDKVNPIPVIQNCFELLHKVEVKTNINRDFIPIQQQKVNRRNNSECHIQPRHKIIIIDEAMHKVWQGNFNLTSMKTLLYMVW